MRSSPRTDLQRQDGSGELGHGMGVRQRLSTLNT